MLNNLSNLIYVVVLFKLLVDNDDALDKLFVFFVFWFNQTFIAVISICAGPPYTINNTTNTKI